MMTGLEAMLLVITGTIISLLGVRIFRARARHDT